MNEEERGAGGGGLMGHFKYDALLRDYQVHNVAMGEGG